MEYSVKDLVKILLKKWYIILLSVCVVGVAAFFLSQASYAQAVKDYDSYTSAMEQIESGAGTVTAVYCVQANTDNEAFLQACADLLSEAEATGMPSTDVLTAYALRTIEPLLPTVLKDAALLQAAQTALELQADEAEEAEPIIVREHWEVQYLGNRNFEVRISGLTEKQASIILETYLAELSQTLSSPVLAYTAEQTSYQFQYDTPEFTDLAELAQIVMQKPASKPSMVKTVCTAAVFAFALSCIIILVVAFIKESAALNKKHANENANQ